MSDTRWIYPALIGGGCVSLNPAISDFAGQRAAAGIVGYGNRRRCKSWGIHYGQHDWFVPGTWS